MSDPKELAAAEAKARGEAATAERQRLADLKAAFPGDTEFVMEQFEKGATVAEAKGAHNDVLRAKLTAQDLELKKLKEGQTQASSAAAAGSTTFPAPVANTGNAEVAGGDFMQKATADQKAHQVACIERITGKKSECCGIVKAMSRTAQAHPALHREYLAKQRERAGEIHDRKMALGMTGPK